MQNIIESLEKIFTRINNLPKMTLNLIVALLTVILAVMIYLFPEQYIFHLAANEEPGAYDDIYLIEMMLILPAIIIIWQIMNNEPLGIAKIFRAFLSKVLIFVWTLILCGAAVFALSYLLVVPGIIFYVYSSFMPVILAVDTPSKRKIRESLKRSIELVKPNFHFVYIYSTIGLVTYTMLSIAVPDKISNSLPYIIIDSLISLGPLTLVYLVVYKYLLETNKSLAGDI